MESPTTQYVTHLVRNKDVMCFGAAAAVEVFMS
jgi:hypothetical protein